MHGVWVRPSLATVTPYPVVASRLGDELDLRKIDCCKMKEVMFAQGDTYRYLSTVVTSRKSLVWKCLGFGQLIRS